MNNIRNQIMRRSIRKFNLGRWGTIRNDNSHEPHVENTIKKNVDWANHDHCGGELCKTPNNENNSEQDYEDSYYLPYVM